MSILARTEAFGCGRSWPRGRLDSLLQAHSRHLKCCREKLWCDFVILILHCWLIDIKPGNVLLDSAGSVKVRILPTLSPHPVPPPCPPTLCAPSHSRSFTPSLFLHVAASFCNHLGFARYFTRHFPCILFLCIAYSAVWLLDKQHGGSLTSSDICGHKRLHGSEWDRSTCRILFHWV